MSGGKTSPVLQRSGELSASATGQESGNVDFSSSVRGMGTRPLGSDFPLSPCLDQVVCAQGW